MSDQTLAGGPLATPAPRAQTLGAQRFVNRIMLALLAAPLVSRGIGSRLITLYLVGCKSGRRLAIPVAYTRHEGDLLIGTPFGWGRNLRTGEPIEIRLKGRRRQADVQVMKDEPEVVAALAIMCRDNHTFAHFQKVGLDASGNPDANDLRLAWAAGARAFRLTPR